MLWVFKLLVFVMDQVAFRPKAHGFESPFNRYKKMDQVTIRPGRPHPPAEPGSQILVVVVDQVAIWADPTWPNHPTPINLLGFGYTCEIFKMPLLIKNELNYIHLPHFLITLIVVCMRNWKRHYLFLSPFVLLKEVASVPINSCSCKKILRLI